MKTFFTATIASVLFAGIAAAGTVNFSNFTSLWEVQSGDKPVGGGFVAVGTGSDVDFSDARGALINVVCGPSLTLGEAEEAASVIRNKINPNAKIIWGATVDESMHEELRVMVVLTGVRSEHIFGAAVTNQLKTLKNRSIEFVN